MYDDDDLPMSPEERTIHRVLSERCSAVYSDPFEAHDAEEGLSFVIRGKRAHVYAWRNSSERVLRSFASQSLEGNLSKVGVVLCYTSPLDWLLWTPSP